MPTKFELAKGRIALHCGYMVPLMSKLKWIDTPAIPVAATNGVNGYYNGEHFEKERNLGEVIFIVLHEIGHCMLAHMRRIGSRDREVANIAMDFALNKRIHDLVAQHPSLKAEVPKDALLDIPRWGDMNWEAIYDILIKDKRGGGCSFLPPQPGGQPGKGGGQGQPGGKTYKMFDEVLPSGQKLDKDGDPVPGSGMSDEDAAILDKGWIVVAQAAATMAKARGVQCGMLEEFINEMIKPNIDWQTQLIDLISRIGRDESSYRRFNRRHLHRESYLPGMYSEHVGPIAFMLDTSGSISRPECAAALGSINMILEDVKPELIYFGQCDTKMQGDVEILTPQDLPIVSMGAKGRGGTDLNPIFAWAVEHQHDIDALIVQTDGHISEIAEHNIPWGLPVIWVATTNNHEYMRFGHVIEVRV